MKFSHVNTNIPIDIAISLVLLVPFLKKGCFIIDFQIFWLLTIFKLFLTKFPDPWCPEWQRRCICWDRDPYKTCWSLHQKIWCKLSMGGAYKQSYLAAAHINHDNYQHGKICNQQLPNWIYGPLNRRETMSDTRNLASFPGLVKSWFLEKNLLSLCC